MLLVTCMQGLWYAFRFYLSIFVMMIMIQRQTINGVHNKIIVNWIISNCFRVVWRWKIRDDFWPKRTDRVRLGRVCFDNQQHKILSFLFLFDLLSPHHTSHTTVCSEVKHKKVKSEQNKKEVMAMKANIEVPFEHKFQHIFNTSY